MDNFQKQLVMFILTTLLHVAHGNFYIYNGLAKWFLIHVIIYVYIYIYIHIKTLHKDNCSFQVLLTSGHIFRITGL